MRLCRGCLLFICLWVYACTATAVSNAPLVALNAYIERSAACSPQLVEWNQTYGSSAIAGETSRGFYYRVLGYMDWGECGRPSFRLVLAELQKVWSIFSKGLVTPAEFEAKEAELIKLFFAAPDDKERGEQLVEEYETRTAVRLLNLVPTRQYFNCTFFGEKARCAD